VGLSLKTLLEEVCYKEELVLLKAAENKTGPLEERHVDKKENRIGTSLMGSIKWSENNEKAHEEKREPVCMK